METTNMAQDDERSDIPLPLEPGDRLVLSCDVGSIDIGRVEPGGTPRIEVRGRHASEAHLDVRREGTTVYVEAKPAASMAALLFGRGARVRMRAYVPADVHARLTTAAGRMRISGLEGCALEIEAEAGSVELDDVFGTLRLVTEAGRIEGRNVGGTIDARTEAGAIRLEIAHLDPGRHEVVTTMGSARLELARGLPVVVNARATMGSAKVDVRSTPGAAALLDVSAELGSVRVRESGRPYHPRDGAAPLEAGPFRTAASASTEPRVQVSEETLDRILGRVASGEITPEAAARLLRALGHA
jgi:hypothetical protein